MTKPATIQAHGGDIVLYRATDGRTALDVRLEQDTIWLSLNQIAALFDRDKSVVSRHLRNIFVTKELDRKAVVAFFATTAADGKAYQVEFFNLDAVLSVGYRVNSRLGTELPDWNRPVKVIDATSFRTPDTHANQKRYHYPAGQKKGCGFPVMRALAIFSLASGAVSQIVTAVCYASEMVMLKSLWHTLLAGDKDQEVQFSEKKVDGNKTLNATSSAH